MKTDSEKSFLNQLIKQLCTKKFGHSFDKKHIWVIKI